MPGVLGGDMSWCGPAIRGCREMARMHAALTWRDRIGTLLATGDGDPGGTTYHRRNVVMKRLHMRAIVMALSGSLTLCGQTAQSAAAQDANDVEALAERLIQAHTMPEQAAADAVHVAAAALGGVNYLLTLNCRHIANAHELPRIYELLDREGLGQMLICTPAEFLGSDFDDEETAAS